MSSRFISLPILLTLSSLLLAVNFARAQTTFGITTSFLTGPLTVIDRQPGAINRFNSDGAGSSIENRWLLGAYTDFRVAEYLILRGSVAGSVVHGSFLSDPYSSFDSTATQQFSVASDALAFITGVEAHSRLSDFDIGLGLGWSLLTSRSSTVQQSSSSNSARLSDTSFSIESPSIGRLTVTGIVGYELPIGPKPRISFVASYDPWLNRYLPIGSSFETGVRLDVPLFFNFDSPMESVPPMQMMPPAVIIGGQRIARHTVLPLTTTYHVKRQYEELPLRVASDDLRVLSSKEASQFNEQDPEVKEQLESHISNVLASRLKVLPTAELIIAGETRAANSVKQYLRNIWKLQNPIVLREDSSLSMLQFSSSDRELLLPLASRVIERKASIPSIEIESSDSLDPITLTVLSRGDTLLHRRARGLGSDRTVTVLPSSLDVAYPIVIVLQSGTYREVDSVTFVESSRDTVEEVQATFRQSFGDTVVLKNRELLLDRFTGAAVTCQLAGIPDAESEALSNRLCGTSRIPRAGGSIDWVLTASALVPKR